MFMEKISIEYLVPVLVKMGQDKHLCMFNYADSSVYFLDQGLSEEKKKEIQDIALRTFVGDNLKEYKFNNNPLINVGSLLSDLKNNKFERYRSFEENEESKED
jgi:hypothetical protein